MKFHNILAKAVSGLVVLLAAASAPAAEYPAPVEGNRVVRDLKFNTGEVLPELRLAYTTIGDPKGEPVVVLHGRAGSARSLLTPRFAGDIFGPGQPLDARLKAPYSNHANDALYQWESSRDYNPGPRLEAIEATLLQINAAADERNPPELGLMQRDIQRVKNGRLLLIAASDQTPGHGTTGDAKWWKSELAEVLRSAPRRQGR